MTMSERRWLLDAGLKLSIAAQAWGWSRALEELQGQSDFLALVEKLTGAPALELEARGDTDKWAEMVVKALHTCLQEGGEPKALGERMERLLGPIA